MNFKPIFLDERTIDSCWFQLLQNVYDHGRPMVKTSGSGEGMTFYTLDFVSGFIHYPHARPLAPIMPEGIPPITTDERIESYFTYYLMDSKLSTNEHYKYATWIVGDDGVNAYTSCNINQLEWIIKHFKTHGYGNNHCYMVIGNPETSYQYNNAYLQCPKCGIYYSKLHKKCEMFYILLD